MIRVILYLAAVLALATGLSWLADTPGAVKIEVDRYVIETTLFRAVVLTALVIGAALVLWSLVRHIWHSPAAVGNLLNRRRNKEGLQALSAGMIAVGSGDRAGATKYALLARKKLPNEPMTHLLRAQAAQLAGDKSTSRRIFEAMLASPDTEPLGLRGLYLEAEREKETEAARHFAERSLALNPKLAWAADAMFEIQCRSSDWAGAIETLASSRKNGLVEKSVADRRRAVLLAAQAIAAEDREPEKALNLALEAHNLAPDLVPAAAQAARMLASRANTPKAAKIVERTWARCPHPDLATVYAYARVGDSPRDRLVRAKRLAVHNPNSVESAIAIANAAVDARDFDAAREALAPVLESGITQRVATLMARIESEQYGDKGRVREWLARAVNAQRDPAWTADGVIADEWSPISPVTGALDAFQWKVPVEMLASRDGDLIARRVEELVALGAPAQGDSAFVSGRPDAKTDNANNLDSKSADQNPFDRKTADAVTIEAETIRSSRSASAPTKSVAPEAAQSASGRSSEAARAAVAATPAAVTKPAASAVETAKADASRPVEAPRTVSAPAVVTAPAAAIGTDKAPVAKPTVVVSSSTPAMPAAPAATSPVVTTAKSTAGAGALASPPPKPAESASNATPARDKTTAANPPNGSSHGEVAPAKPLSTSSSSAAREFQAKDAKLAAAVVAARSGQTASSGDPLQDLPAPTAKSAGGSAVAVTVDDSRAGASGKNDVKDPGRETSRIFVVPQAPDDPGPDGADAEPSPPKGNRPPYRALP